jgi:hypothetical protein
MWFHTVGEKPREETIMGTSFGGGERRIHLFSNEAVRRTNYVHQYITGKPLRSYRYVIRIATSSWMHPALMG